MTVARSRIAVLAQCLLTSACASGGSPPDPGHDTPGDVRNFGAVCDGRVDDTRALIRAGQGVQAVYVAPGLTCRVTGPLAAGIRPGQRWYGGGTITTDDGFNFTVFSVAGKTDVTFDGLAARSGRLGAPYNSANGRFIEFISGAHRGRAVNNRISGFQQAIRVHNSTDTVVDDNEVSDAYGWGISIQTGADRAEVARNRVSGTVGEHGIYASGSAGKPIGAVVLRGNTVSGSKIDGIKLTYVESTTVVGNSTSSNGGQGIYLTMGTVRGEVRENVSQSNGDNGILVYDSTTTSADNRLAGNTVRGNRSDGIVVSSAASGAVVRTRVTDNEIEANGGANGGERYGIVVSGPATTQGTIITGNTIRRQRVGAYVSGGRDTTIGANVYDRCDTPVIAPFQRP